MSAQVEIEVGGVEIHTVSKTTGVGKDRVTQSGLALVTPECEVTIMGDSVAMRGLLDRMASAVASPQFGSLWDRGFGDG